MAVAHIQFNSSTQHGAILASALRKLEDGVKELNSVFDAMESMKDNGAITAYLADKFGFPDIAAATAAYNELSTLQTHLTTNPTNAALRQCFKKFR